MKKEIFIYTGSFGSGKTELAINHAQKANKEGKKVVIVDLDIVNPYFRSREMREKLKDDNITVMAPPGKLAMADLPLIMPETKGLIQTPQHSLILDVGGDDIGAKSLASFYPVLKDKPYRMLMVINPYRPFTKNKEEIGKMLQEIEQSSRLKVNGLISNLNLGNKTDLQTVMKGHQIIQQTARSLKLPVAYLAVLNDLYQTMKNHEFDIDIFPIQRFMKLPW